jgi:phosphatidate cytidylyltransferase
MNNFLTRTITAVFFSITCVACIFFGGYIHLLFFIFSILAFNEYLKINGPKKRKALNRLYVLFALIMSATFALAQLGAIDEKYIWINVFSMASIFLIELYQKEQLPFDQIGKLILGYAYVIIPFAMFTGLGHIVSGDYNYEIPLGFLFLVWANDSGAYVFGITLGKNRLFERISPKKSWEGFFGGLIIAGIVAYIISLYFQSINTTHWLTLSAIIVVFGTLGDLIESMLKRSKDIKDSGNILPGHGGILDRFDALLIAAPLVYAYLHLFL